MLKKKEWPQLIKRREYRFCVNGDQWFYSDLTCCLYRHRVGELNLCFGLLYIFWSRYDLLHRVVLFFLLFNELSYWLFTECVGVITGRKIILLAFRFDRKMRMKLDWIAVGEAELFEKVVVNIFKLYASNLFTHGSQWFYLRWLRVQDFHYFVSWGKWRIQWW